MKRTLSWVIAFPLSIRNIRTLFILKRIPFCYIIDPGTTINVVPSNITAMVGDRVVLNCSGQGQLSWYQKPNREVIPQLDDDHFEILPEGPLLFHSVRKEDEGFYQCSVKSNDSKVMRNTHWAYLRVLGKLESNDDECEHPLYSIILCYLQFQRPFTNTRRIVRWHGDDTLMLIALPLGILYLRFDGYLMEAK